MSSNRKAKGSRTKSKSPSRSNSNSKSHVAQHSNNSRNSLINDAFLKMIQGASVTAASKFTSQLGLFGSDSSKEEKTNIGTAKEFDLYLLAQSWAPQFCCTSNGAHAKQCKKENIDDVNDLVIHGLWPAFNKPNKSGQTYPQFCPIVPSITSNDSKGLSGRMKHEWEKHGTCTGINAQQYFELEQHLADSEANDTNIFISNIRDVLNNHSGESIDVADIIEYGGGPNKIAIMSTNYCQLQEITTCWDKEKKIQIDCPVHVLSSSRNSAVLQHGCKKVYLDISDSNHKCAFISKEMLNILKGKS